MFQYHGIYQSTMRLSNTITVQHLRTTKVQKSHISSIKITWTQKCLSISRVHANSHHIVLCITSYSKNSHWREHGLWQHGCNSSAQLAPEHQCYDTAVSPCSRPAVPCRPIWLFCPEDTLMNLNQLPATAQDKQLAAWNYHANEACELLSWTWLWKSNHEPLSPIELFN